MATKTKSKTRARRPLTIAIHGEDLHIEAKFSDAHLSELLADTVKRVNNSVQRAYSAQSASAQSAGTQPPIADLVVELTKSLRTDQVEALNNIFDAAQNMLFMEILRRGTPHD